MNRAELLVDGHRILPALLRDIAAVKRDIHISMFLYFRDLIGKEARPSLRVVLIVPALEWNDNALAHDAGQYWYRAYLKAGIGVHEYQNHFNHLKTAAFAGRLSVHGSTNLNFRSLGNDKDFELVVFVEDQRLAKQVLTHVRDVALAALPHLRTFRPAQLQGAVSGADAGSTHPAPRLAQASLTEIPSPALRPL